MNSAIDKQDTFDRDMRQLHADGFALTRPVH